MSYLYFFCQFSLSSATAVCFRDNFLSLSQNAARKINVLLTCFENLVAQRKPRPLMGVVRHELDLQGGPRREDGRRGDVAAVSTQDVGPFRGPVADLDEVVPEPQERGGIIVILYNIKRSSVYIKYNAAGWD